jgi:hypothetical protein
MMRLDFMKGMIQQYFCGATIAASKIVRSLSKNGSEKI